MDALTIFLILMTIYCVILYWIAWKQEMQARGRAKQKKEQKP